ncbi:hypothetical protein FSP39_000696 [Pinctada imbricata]|uniref:Protein kinase domain-containing protein n=1 Tax=Pinctada imbricata TaxID=66713 RepID=A0AA89BUH1_PINIB|nr:hypothetical protein FSP39_000696 [Pinctada imbricata]
MVTDHRTWMEKIRQHGNKPEDWLDFLRFMQQRTNYTGLKRCNFLSPLFEKALKVYKVLDTSNFAILALKVVKLDDTKEQIIEGFKNEISLLKRLQYCPRVIQLHDFEIRDEEKRIYILMESGELDLDRHIKNLIQQEGKLSPIDVKYHWRSMLQAVAALHKEGIIHSDLKPSNFLLINGQLKLIDFGIAKTIQQDKTSIVTDCQVGTLNYMSPETIQENIGLTESGGKAVFKIGVKSDVWSLGCILYNMVYGYTPFQKIARQFAKFLAITDPNHVIQFPDIPDKSVLDVMKVKLLLKQICCFQIS